MADLPVLIPMNITDNDTSALKKLFGSNAPSLRHYEGIENGNVPSKANLLSALTTTAASFTDAYIEESNATGRRVQQLQGNIQTLEGGSVAERLPAHLRDDKFAQRITEFFARMLLRSYQKDSGDSKLV